MRWLEHNFEVVPTRSRQFRPHFSICRPNLGWWQFSTEYCVKADERMQTTADTVKLLDSGAVLRRVGRELLATAVAEEIIHVEHVTGCDLTIRHRVVVNDRAMSVVDVHENVVIVPHMTKCQRLTGSHRRLQSAERITSQLLHLPQVRDGGVVCGDGGFGEVMSVVDCHVPSPSQ